MGHYSPARLRPNSLRTNSLTSGEFKRYKGLEASPEVTQGGIVALAILTARMSVAFTGCTLGPVGAESLVHQVSQQPDKVVC